MLGAFRRENRGSFFGLAAYTSGVEVLRFYGFGNETEATAGPEEYYKVNANQILLYPAFNVPFGSKGLFSLGPAAKYTQSDESKDQFINQDKPYGVGDFGQLALHGVLSWGNQDNQIFPRKGFLAAARGTYYLKTWDVVSDFGEVERQRQHLSLGRSRS